MFASRKQKMLQTSTGTVVFDLTKGGPNEVFLKSVAGAFIKVPFEDAMVAASYQKSILVLSSLSAEGLIWQPAGAPGTLRVPLGSSIELRTGDVILSAPYTRGGVGVGEDSGELGAVKAPTHLAIVPDPMAERAKAILGRLREEDSGDSAAEDGMTGGKPKKKKKKTTVGKKDLSEYAEILRQREKEDRRAERHLDERAARARRRAATHTYEVPDGKLKKMTPTDRAAFQKDYDDIKPFCKYGTSCYQKNEHHLRSFRHDFHAKGEGDKYLAPDPLVDDDKEED